MKIDIIVHANSKHARVDRDWSGLLHVYVREPSLHGRANQAVVAALAKHFQVKKYQIKIAKGLRSKHKTCEILD